MVVSTAFPLPVGDDANMRIESIGCRPRDRTPEPCACGQPSVVVLVADNGHGAVSAWLCWPCARRLYGRAVEWQNQAIAVREAQIRTEARRKHAAYRDVEADWPEPMPGFYF